MRLIIEELIKITDIEGRKRLDFYANTRRIAREIRRIEKYTKDQTFVINQILEKSVFFFPFSLFLGKGFMTRSYVSSPMEEKIPVTRVRSRHSHRPYRKNFFYISKPIFSTATNGTCTNFQFQYQVATSIADRWREKRKNRRDYSFARKENRFRLIRCFALRMFYVSFDKIL